MFTEIYREKKTYSPFDSGLFLLFLGEKETDFVSGHNMPGADEAPAEPVKGYSYTGTHESGGTLIEAKDATYGAFVSGLIRKQYTADDVEALQANAFVAMKNPKHEKAAEYNQAWEAFQVYRNECKRIVNQLLKS